MKGTFTMLINYLVAGVIGIGVVTLFREIQFIRAYPDQADRTYRETGKRPE